MKVNNYSSISFKSKIKILSQEEFKKLPLADLIKNKQYIDYPWSVDEILISTKAFTDGIADCSAGGITNGKRVMMFHLSTESLLDFGRVKRVFEAGIKELKKDNLPLNGLLTGADDRLQSGILSSRLNKLIENNEVNFSKIKHQNIDGHLDLFYSAEDDSWILAPNSIIKNASDLKNHFKNISLLPSDELFIHDKNIPKKSLKFSWKDLFRT